MLQFFEVESRFAENAEACRQHEEFKNRSCDQTCYGRAKKCKINHKGCFCKPGWVRNPQTMSCIRCKKCPKKT